MTPDAAIRVALLTNELPPYRIPLVRSLAKAQAWDIHVILDSPGSISHRLAEDLQVTVLGSPRMTRTRQAYGTQALQEVDRVYLSGKLPRLLFGLNPDVVITGEMGSRTATTLAIGALKRFPVIAWVESTSHTSLGLRPAQKIVRRFIRNRPDAYICPGAFAKEYLSDLGVTKPIVSIGQPVQVPDLPEAQRPQIRKEVRSHLGLDTSGRVVLFAGRLTQTKGIRELLTAWTGIPAQIAAHSTLLLVGSGPEDAWVTEYVQSRNLTNVLTLGWVEPARMPEIRAASDLFVLPTHGDCYSLAAAEAGAAGLPLIASVYGGESELVEPGVTGWICDPRRIAQLRDTLVASLTEPSLPEMSRAIQRRSGCNSYENSAREVARVVQSVTTNR